MIEREGFPSDYDAYCERLGELTKFCSQCGEEHCIAGDKCNVCGSFEPEDTEVMTHPPEGCMTDSEEYPSGTVNGYSDKVERVHEEAASLQESDRFLLAKQLMESLNGSRRNALKQLIEAEGTRRVRELETALAEERRSNNLRGQRRTPKTRTSTSKPLEVKP